MKKTLTAIALLAAVSQVAHSNDDGFDNLGSCRLLSEKAKQTTDFFVKKDIYEKQRRCYEKFLYETKEIPTQARSFIAKDADGGQFQLFSNVPDAGSIKTTTVKNAEAAQGLAENDPKLSDATSKSSFLGMNLGYGFAVVHYDDKIVEEAAVDANGNVVATKQKQNEAKVVLEFHTSLWNNEAGDKGVGLFAAILVGNDDLLDGVGIGPMMSFKNSNKNDNSGFTIGIGAAIENDVNQLADGFEVGKPLPSGETAVRYVEKDEISPFLFISNNF